MYFKSWKITMAVLVFAFCCTVANAMPAKICIQGTLQNNKGVLYGDRVWTIQYYNASTGGAKLGGLTSGTLFVNTEGRWTITLTPPAEVIAAPGNVWYQLAIDSAPYPDGQINPQDVFSTRVNVESVLFAQRAASADTFGGLSAVDYATTGGLKNSLAAKSDTTHGHNLQDLGGAVTDAQVPDDITIDHAATASHSDTANHSDTATTASVALTVLGDSVNHSTLANHADTATTATIALGILGDTVGHADMADGAATASLAVIAIIALDSDSLGGIPSDDYITTGILATALATKSDTTHGHNLQDLSGAVTDAQVPNDITISSSGAVDAAALKSGTVPSARLNLADSDVPDAITVSSSGSVDAAALKSGTVPSARLSLADSDIPNAITIAGGTVNNTPIGATTPAAGSFTTLAANTLDTGQGASELYAMDQPVRTTDDVTFNQVTATTATFGTNSVTIDDDIIVASGGRVGVGTASPAAALDVNIDASSVLDQSQEVVNGARSLTNHWQSFTAGQTGLLAKVSFLPVTTPPTNATLKIYAGEGTGGALLHTQTGISGANFVWKEVELSAQIPVTAGTQYTFELSQASSFILVRATDLYPGGMYDNSSDVDLAFRTYVLGPPDDSLRVASQVVIGAIPTAPSTTTARLYNLDGDLYWAGSQVLTAGSVTVEKGGILNNGALGFDWADSEVADDLTVSSSGAVDAAALKSGTVPSARLSLADSDIPNAITISGGTVNNTPIGATTPAAGAFTTLVANTLNTGQGVNELYAMNQNVQTTDAVTFSTVNTGQGTNELYAMNQNVRTSDDVAFNQVSATTATFGTNSVTIDDDILVASGGMIGIGTDTPTAPLHVSTLSSDQSSSLDNNDFPHYNPVAQSFTAGKTGNLAQMDLKLRAESGTAQVTVGIYNGNTPGSGALLSSLETVDITKTTHDVYSVVFATPAALTGGQAYHAVITEVSGSFRVAASTGGAGPYAGGTMWRWVGSWSMLNLLDLYFTTYMGGDGDLLKLQGQSLVVVDGSGKVGIGTDSPSEALEVQGVVKVNDTTDAPATTTDRLYNNGGNLYWNGTQLGAGGGSANTVDTIGCTFDSISSGWNGYPVWAQKMKHSGTIVSFQIYAETVANGTANLLKNGTTVLSAPVTFVNDVVVEGTVTNTTFSANDVFKIVFDNATGDHYPAVFTLIVKYD